VIGYHLFEVEVFIDSDWNAPLFTGKLVKSLLIDANPDLKPVFKKTSGPEPKLIHITPLYEANNDRIRCIYSQARREPAKGNGKKPKVNPVQLKGRYRFYIGFVESGRLGFDAVFNAVMNLSGSHIFSNKVFNVEVLAIKSVDVEKHVRDIVHALTGGNSKAKLRVVFASPTQLRDPFRLSKYKSFAPISISIFSTPVYIYLYLARRLRQEEFYNTVIMMHRVLNEAHTVNDTVRKVWVLYESGKNPIPALIGYVNLHVNHDYYKRYSKRYQIEDFLTEIFKIMATLGTGTSRATGFGHVIIEPIKRNHPYIRHTRRSEEFSAPEHIDL